MIFYLLGEYENAYIVLNHARDRFVNEPISHIWMYCEHFSCYKQAYHNQLWQVAETCARKIAAFDQWESLLYLVEIDIARGNYQAATDHLNNILNCVDHIDNLHKIDLKIKAMILLAEIKCSQFVQGNVSSELLMILNEALELSEKYYLKYSTAVIQLHIAHVQLWMKMPNLALDFVNQALITILANGGLYDRARALLLYVKCFVANTNTSSGTVDKNHEIKNCALLLNSVKGHFEKVQAYARVKDVLYLQVSKYFELNFTNIVY